MICEQCGHDHDGSYGSGRFCSEHCRRVWIGKQANLTMKKNGTKKCNFHSHKENNGRKPYGTWKCERCNLIFETRSQLQEHNHQFHPIQKGSSWNKGLTKENDFRVARSAQTFQERIKNGEITPTWRGKHLSEQHKRNTSNGMKRAISSGKALSWKSQKGQSYPEIYWMNILNQRKISFNYQKLVPKFRYFLDFEIILSNGLKIDLEINGSQHQYRIYQDKLRDKRNRELGYLVYRIQWNNVSGRIGKMRMNAKINQFLWWLRQMEKINT